MYRILLASTLAIGLALISGCWSRSTEPVHGTSAVVNSDRVKRMKEAAFPKIKRSASASKNAR